jgi:hypothetical protein
MLYDAAATMELGTGTRARRLTCLKGIATVEATRGTHPSRSTRPLRLLGLVVQVNQDDDTSQMVPAADVDDEPTGDPAPGEPVGRINLEDAADADEGAAPVDATGDDPLVPASTMQKILFGAIAVLLMAMAMVVILQGVFEQKMPV